MNIRHCAIGSLALLAVSEHTPAVGSNPALFHCMHRVGNNTHFFAISTSRASCIAIHESEQTGEKFSLRVTSSISPIAYFVSDPMGETVSLSHPGHHDDPSCYIDTTPANTPGGNSYP